ncbi:TPA: hypothetical protein TZY53_000682 [Streptococcus suis]|nr:hypothetical protein [Streptococcus suis]
MTNEKLGVLLVDVPEPKHWEHTYVVRPGVFFNIWGSDTIGKVIEPFRSQKRNNLFREVIKKTLNYYLGTLFSDEDIALVYQRLGNGINPELTYRFIDSGFDMEVLDDS